MFIVNSVNTIHLFQSYLKIGYLRNFMNLFLFILKYRIIYVLKNKKKLLISLVFYAFSLISIFILFYFLNHPKIRETVIPQLSKSPFLLLAFTLIYFIVFYKYNLYEHRGLIFFPIRKAYFVLLSMIYELFQTKTLLLFLLIYLKLLSINIYLSVFQQVLLFFIYYIFFATTFFIGKLSYSNAKWNFINYISLVFLIVSFFINSIVLIEIIFSLLTILNLFLLSNQKDRDMIKLSKHKSSFFTIKFGNIFLVKELSLLTRHKKGRQLIIFTYSSLLFSGVLLLFLINYSQNTASLESLIFFISSGIFMAEYFQYILSWDYKNIGIQYILPLNHKQIMDAKFNLVRLILLSFSILAFIILWPINSGFKIIIVFILNLILLPNIYLFISFTAFQRVDINKSTLNMTYYQRPIKAFIIITPIIIGEYLFLLFINFKEIAEIIYYTTFGLAIIFCIVLEIILKKLYAKYYNKWLTKYFHYRENTFDF